jgi:murein DD-endopeptidase MepM/ murein hydrolase activator NlpD
MRTLSRHELAARRETRRRRERRRRGLTVLLGSIPVAAGLVAIALLTASGDGSQIAETPGPVLATPLPATELGTARRPPNVTLADVEGVEIRLPFPRDLATAVIFHPVESSSAVRLGPRTGIGYDIAPRRGRSGPETAALDVGAPAGTAVYAPVSGVVAVVSPYTVAGKEIGYEMAIAPSSAAGLLVRITHLDAPAKFEVPKVGTPVASGVTEIGRVADFSSVVEQEIAQFTNDSGNHVHIEMIRAGSGT